LARIRYQSEPAVQIAVELREAVCVRGSAPEELRGGVGVLAAVQDRVDTPAEGDDRAIQGLSQIKVPLGRKCEGSENRSL